MPSPPTRCRAVLAASALFGPGFAGGAAERSLGGPLQGRVVPDPTGESRQEVGNRSVTEMIGCLRTGIMARSRASGPMAEVVGHSSSLMTEPDFAPSRPSRGPAGRGRWRLDGRRIAHVTTTTRNSWGNQAPAATPGDAARLRGMLAAAPR